MTVYKDLETNSEVMDVLYCIVLEHSTVKSMQELLKQPQSTISTKLQFLRQTEVIIKDKWNFQPNWGELYSRMYKVLKGILRSKYKIKKVEKLKSIIGNVEKYFPNTILKSLLRVYSWVFEQGYEKISLYELLSLFLNKLTTSNELDKISDNLIEVKKVLMEIPSKEDILFSKLTKEF